MLLLDAAPDTALLAKHYPAAHPLIAIGTGGESAVTLATLGSADARFVVFPPVDPYVDLASVAAITRITERLRAPNGCPWDRQQTHASLRPHLLEEAYETLEAIDSGDLPRLRDELGDLLLQVALHAQLAYEEGAFDIGDIAARLNDKLIRRHPHVFAGAEISDDLLQQWERIKREEREAGGKAEESVTAGIPKDLPALFASERLQERAARVGLTHERIDLPLDIDDASFLGDLLFDVVAVARERGFDAETALREANERFVAHVARLEARARADGRALESYSADEMRSLWDATTQ